MSKFKTISDPFKIILLIFISFLIIYPLYFSIKVQSICNNLCGNLKTINCINQSFLISEHDIIAVCGDFKNPILKTMEKK